MREMVILLLIILLGLNELLGAYYGTVAKQMVWRRWVVNAIYFLMVVYVYIVARQIEALIRKF